MDLRGEKKWNSPVKTNSLLQEKWDVNAEGLRWPQAWLKTLSKERLALWIKLALSCAASKAASEVLVQSRASGSSRSERERERRHSSDENSPYSLREQRHSIPTPSPFPHTHISRALCINECNNSYSWNALSSWAQKCSLRCNSAPQTILQCTHTLRRDWRCRDWKCVVLSMPRGMDKSLIPFQAPRWLTTLDWFGNHYELRRVLFFSRKRVNWWSSPLFV